jgi:hypothetical protein
LDVNGAACDTTDVTHVEGFGEKVAFTLDVVPKVTSFVEESLGVIIAVPQSMLRAPMVS